MSPIWPFAALSLACAGALLSCSSGRPPQTGFYCVDIPQGSSVNADRFVEAVAERLGFKTSKAQFPSRTGPPDRAWEVYGSGISLFIDTAMKDGKPDRFGNRSHAFNPNRLSLQVVRTG